MNMDLRLIPSPHTKLRCFVCKNYLSYFPISLCSNKRSLCGRCTVPEGLVAFEDEPFEILLEAFRFPCRYKSEGCCEEFVPKDIPKHEQSCLYQEVPCVLSTFEECEWKGMLSTISRHCKEKHSESILGKDWFPVDVFNSNERYNLLEDEGVLLIFLSRFDIESKTLYCALYYNEYEVNVDCTIVLSLKDSKRSVSLELEATECQEIIFSDLCLHPLMNRCDNQESLLARVTVSRKKLKRTISKPLMNIKSKLEEHSILKCSSCSKSLLPFVYQDIKNDKVFCLQCKSKDSQTHFDLNFCAVGKLLHYPCKYRTNGCTSIAKYSQTKDHQTHCEFADKNCVLKELGLLCGWKGMAKDVSGHILSSHQDLFITLSEVELKLEVTNVKCNFFKFSTCIFLLVYYVDENLRYVWSVQQINGELKENLKYEIDLVDVTNGGQRLLITHNCTELTGREELDRAELGFCCYLEEEQVENFFKLENENESSVRFRVRVFK